MQEGVRLTPPGPQLLDLKAAATTFDSLGAPTPWSPSTDDKPNAANALTTTVPHAAVRSRHKTAASPTMRRLERMR
jgi:hypothetical protein